MDMPEFMSGEARLWSVLRRLRGAEDRKAMRRVGIVALVVLLLGSGAWATIEFWPHPQPDFLADPMDEVLDFTLLTGDFNKLPLDKRLGLIKDLIQRLKTMSAEDSMLMAAFATRLKEEARRQLEQNAKRLAVDMLDDYAQGYAHVPPGDRGAYLDQKALDFTRMLEDLAGERSGLAQDDNERLAQLKHQAKKDEEQMQQGDRKMRPEVVGGFLKFLQKDSEKLATPVQQARMAKFGRDMVRHLRGEDVDGVAPRPPADGETPGEGTGDGAGGGGGDDGKGG